MYVLPEPRKLGEKYYRAYVLVFDQQLANAGWSLARRIEAPIFAKQGS